MFIELAFLVLSIVTLYLGAEFALEAAEKIGVYLGLSPLVIGLLIIGFGTSLPEFVVSQLACMRGENELALGNIVGSNIANLLLILGISGILAPLPFLGRAIFQQTILHFVLACLLAVILFYQNFSVLFAFILGGFFVFYLGQTLVSMHKEKGFFSDEEKKNMKAPGAIVYFKLALGFAFLYGGGELIVSSGTALAKMFGVSSFVVSAIFVALGTSFPELVTALIACVKKKDTQLIVGNVIGSNIFNVAFVMASLAPYKIKIGQDYFVEAVVLLLTAFILLSLAVFQKSFNRIIGTLFLIGHGMMVYYWVTS